MSNQDMLKIAFERGLRDVVDRLEIVTPDAALVKEAIFKKMWGGLKRMVGRVAKGSPRLKAPVKPGEGASAQQLEQYAKANTEYSAKRLQGAGYKPTAGAEEAAKFTERVGPEGKEWLKTVGESGSRGMLGGGLGLAGFAMPTAAGAGLGYAVGGEEGALAGAGLGFGARLGGSGLIQKLREAKGFTGALGKKAPGFGEMLKTEAGKKALMAGGALGAGLGGAGYAAGRMSRPPEEPWYSGMGVGLTPQQTQEVGQMAMPLLSERLGLDPSVVQALGAQYGFAPMQEQTEQPMELSPEEMMQLDPSGYEYY